MVKISVYKLLVHLPGIQEIQNYKFGEFFETLSKHWTQNSTRINYSLLPL